MELGCGWGGGMMGRWKKVVWVDMANRHYIDVEPFKEQGLLKKRNA